MLGARPCPWRSPTSSRTSVRRERGREGRRKGAKEQGAPTLSLLFLSSPRGGHLRGVRPDRDLAPHLRQPLQYPRPSHGHGKRALPPSLPSSLFFSLLRSFPSSSSAFPLPLPPPFPPLQQVGQLIGDADVRIVKDGHEVDPGEEGEVWVSSSLPHSLPPSLVALRSFLCLVHHPHPFSLPLALRLSLPPSLPRWRGRSCSPAITTSPPRRLRPSPSCMGQGEGGREGGREGREEGRGKGPWGVNGE